MVVAATTAVHPDSDGTRGGGVVAGGEPSTTDTSTTTWAWQWSSILLHHIVLTLHARCANRYYYLAAVAAVMKYMEHVQQVTYAAHSLHIILTSSDNTLALGKRVKFSSRLSTLVLMPYNTFLKTVNFFTLSRTPWSCWTHWLTLRRQPPTNPLLVSVTETVSSTVLSDLLKVLRGSRKATPGCLSSEGVYCHENYSVVMPSTAPSTVSSTSLERYTRRSLTTSLELRAAQPDTLRTSTTTVRRERRGEHKETKREEERVENTRDQERRGKSREH
ncbi:hypothetical protein Pcinc_037580 [Petrolisthes cinctipes]|uniref:Uncharacterized protein n=1 Tax=Petrolisthes cinctipes TaxID=88211 RepID=A0AAE1BVG2_PETCI|nr:hypothetical protein Pcinc_037580 [Petrolisthes cinctipes]